MKSARHAALLVWLSFSGCTTRPPETLTLDVAEVIDVSAARGAQTVRIERGLIRTLEAREAGGAGRLAPGAFSIWRREGLPSPDELAALLARGVTSLALIDRPLLPSLALREYVGTARGRGPRIYVSGPELGTALEADATPLRYRGRVQDYVALGSQLIVIDAARGHDAVCAVVEEAERQGGWVWLRAHERDALGQTVTCGPRAVWVQPGLTEPFVEQAPPGTVWIFDALPEAIPEGRLVARFGPLEGPPPAAELAERTVNAARTLGSSDAVSRVRPGYVADLVWWRDGEATVFVEGVEQAARRPWLAGALLAWAQFQLNRRAPDDL